MTLLIKTQKKEVAAHPSKSNILMKFYQITHCHAFFVQNESLPKLEVLKNYDTV